MSKKDWNMWKDKKPIHVKPSHQTPDELKDQSGKSALVFLEEVSADTAGCGSPDQANGGRSTSDVIADQLPRNRWRMMGGGGAFDLNLFSHPIGESKCSFVRAFHSNTLTGVFAACLEYLITEENYKPCQSTQYLKK